MATKYFCTQGGGRDVDALSPVWKASASASIKPSAREMNISGDITNVSKMQIFSLKIAMSVNVAHLQRFYDLYKT